MKQFKALALMLFLALAYALPHSTLAQTYPDKPIRLIVPFPPGGGADQLARILAEPLTKRLGQAVIVDNKGGAGGTLAADFVAHSAPDGYTLLYVTPGQQMVNPHLMLKLPYDPVNGFVAICQLVEAPNVLVVHKDFPAKNIAELIAYAKANPGKVNFASSGIGASSHLAGELFKQMAGIDIIHVAYKGSGLSVTDVLGGRVQMTIDTLSVYMQHIKVGAVRALGVSSPERSPLLPGVPAIAETLPGFNAQAVNYVSAPAGTPRAIVNRLNKEINAVLDMPAVQAKFHAMGGSGLKGGTPEQMEALVKSESAKWKKVIELSGAKPQ